MEEFFALERAIEAEGGHLIVAVVQHGDSQCITTMSSYSRETLKKLFFHIGSVAEWDDGPWKVLKKMPQDV